MSCRRSGRNHHVHVTASGSTFVCCVRHEEGRLRSATVEEHWVGVSGSLVDWLSRRPILAGAGVGLAWGISMRAWMRLISTDPEFSWSGTLFILGASATVGTLLGVARRRRQAGGTGWWRLNSLSLLLLGAGGAVMWPGVVLGALAMGRPWPRFWKMVLGLAAIATQVPVLQGVISDNWRMSAFGASIAVVWYAPMIALEAWGFSIAFSPAIDGARLPGRLNRIGPAFALLAFGVAAAAAIGIPGS